MRVIRLRQIGLACMATFLMHEARARPHGNAEALQASIDTTVTVGADGLVRIGDLKGMSPKLAEAVRAELVRLHYIPAERGGVPVESELRLSGIALLNQVDGAEYTLTLKNVAVVPAAATILKATPPRYPPEWSDGIGRDRSKWR